MAETSFGSAIYVQRSNFVQEVASLREVFDVLDEWPEEMRDLAYDTLQKACRNAANGRFPLGAVKENFRRFVKRAGMLVEIGGVPLVPPYVNDQGIGNAS
jgi:hypothetical protein